MKISEEKLEKIYRKIRLAIFAFPVIVVLIGSYLILFPHDSYSYLSNDQKQSRFEIAKDQNLNRLSFGVFPLRDYRFIELEINFKKGEPSGCQNANAAIKVSKTYEAFLYPLSDPITSQQQLNDFLFADNKSKYPNGSLLHLKPTNQVFLISQGKKILFPGPEILQAFGYSFDNLTDVEKSDIDQFPDAETRFFSWSIAHPNGTIFQSYPSHSLYLVFDGKKYPIASKELLDRVWPKNFTIPVSDYDTKKILTCNAKKTAAKLSCEFDSIQLSDSIGRYYHFSVELPEKCRVESIHPASAAVSFYSEKSWKTIEDSMRNIALSVINRYFYNQ